MTKLNYGISEASKEIEDLVRDPYSKVDYTKIKEGFVKISIYEDIYYVELILNESLGLYNCSKGK
jgi:hypothetical protein